MRAALARSFATLLIIVHAGLAMWALVGLLELGLSSVPWPRISNLAFSPSMLALQWGLIATAASVFIAGYLRRWTLLPKAMLVIYGAMASVCAIQTFFILTNPSRFRAMAIEYAEYGVILLFLFYSDHMRERLGTAPETASRASDASVV
jgi:hypothetical protein